MYGKTRVFFRCCGIQQEIEKQRIAEIARACKKFQGNPMEKIESSGGEPAPPLDEDLVEVEVEE